MISQQDMDKYKTSMQDQLAIRTFVDNLIKERKDPEVTPETLPVVHAMLVKQVNQAINEHFISLLNDTDVVELDKLLDANIPDNELNDFFRKKVDNISVEIATALLNFRAAYLYPVWKKQQEEQVAASSAQAEATKAASAEASAVKEEKKVEDLDQLPPAPVM